MGKGKAGDVTDLLTLDSRSPLKSETIELAVEPAANDDEAPGLERIHDDCVVARAVAMQEQQERSEKLRAAIAEQKAMLPCLTLRTAAAKQLLLEHASELCEAQKGHPLRMASLQASDASLRKALRDRKAALEAEEHTKAEMLTAIEEGEHKLQHHRERLGVLETNQEANSIEQAGLFEQVRRVKAAANTARARHDACAEDLAQMVLLMRRLHNEYLSAKGNIRVFCRVRPRPLSCEDDELRVELGESAPVLTVHAEPQRSVTGLVEHASSWDFSFDHVFGPSASQAAVFDEIALLVQSALDGYRVAIFAYGQTGSGKTHTMQGPPPDRKNADELGMLPRTVDLIFAEVEALQKSGWTFEVHAGAFEVYNEAARDLCAETRGAGPSQAQASARTAPHDGEDLARRSVADAPAVHALFRRAARERHTAATSANDHSSRSHAIFQLRLSGHCDVGGRHREVQGLLSFVDLAGSERVEKSGASGDRLREAQHINRSLSALADVVEALARRSRGEKAAHIPYRNSRLTTMLRDSLGGESKALMFVNVSTLRKNLSETVSSLRFASKVHGCTVGVAKRQLADVAAQAPSAPVEELALN